MTTTLGRSAEGSPVPGRAGGAGLPTGRPPGAVDVQPPEEPPVSDRVRRRLHLLAVSVAIVVLTFVQAPGRIAPDTKADLSIDPVGFLLRAWHLWEPLGDSGQLQNQAYGYFLPMGPFYALGNVLGIPAWIVQRGWWSLVFLVAFHGAYRLIRRMEIGTHPIQLIAGLTYALSPRMITEVGPVSIEAWPMAMAPWVLLPLIKVTPGGEATAAARSGVAVALCGGVNAVAVGAVLPLPVWWLITRERGAVRARLARWWALAVVLGITWWLGPLLLLGRYSAPFLDWVESSAVSTSKAALPGAFRGTTQWVAWFQLPQPIWLAGWSVLSSPVGILLGWLLIAISLLGMLRRDMPHRRFVIGAAIGGLALLTMGHTGPLTAPWAGAVQDFLDGAGAPLRNTHKFDLVLRLPMAIALAHALASTRVPTVPGLPSLVQGRRALPFIATCALVGSAAPALLGQLPARGSFVDVPDHWREAAAWLEENDDGGRTLIVPGSTFATSVWGDPHDEPFQALARTKWATRSTVPLSSAGNIRMLSAVEQQLATGRGSAGLAEYLARAGFSRVLLRADLVRSFQPGSAPLPVIVRSALEQSPGITPVARFGDVYQGLRRDGQVADDGLDVPLNAIEIWQIQAPSWPASVYRAADTLRVAGGPESLLALTDAGRLGRRPTVLDGDPEAEALQDAPLVVTDTPQRREATFSQVRDTYSQVMTATEPYVNDRKVHDWMPFEQPLVTARYEGITGVRASSSAATAFGPWAAVDSDPLSTWSSSVFSEGQWLEVTFPEPRAFPANITLTPGVGGAVLSKVEVRTDQGSATTELARDLTGLAQQLTVPPGETRSLRITVRGVWSGGGLLPVSIRDIDLPGVEPRRPLVLPPVAAAGAPDTAEPVMVSVRQTRDGVDGCVFSEARAVCSPRLRQQSQDGDLDRIVTLPSAQRYDLRATARLREGTGLDALLRPRGAITLRASSRIGGEPAQRPDAAMDGDLGTAWMASITDRRPTLVLTWDGVRSVNALRWQMDPGLTASAPVQLQVTGGSGTRTVTVGADGWVRFPAVRGERLEVAVSSWLPLQSRDRATGYPGGVPVGLSELVVPALQDLRGSVPEWQPVNLPCGQGPALTVNGREIRTRLAGTAGAILRREPISVLPCAEIGSLAGGSTRLSLTANERALPVAMVLLSEEWQRQEAARGEVATTAPAGIQEVGPERRVITVAPRDEDQVLVVHENANPGWRATLGGVELTSVRVDGWQQGWIVPAGSGGQVDLLFTPGTAYRATLVAGLLLVLLLVLLAFPRRRRKSHRRRSRHAALVPLDEAPRARGYGLVATGGVIAIGGLWGAAALLGVLLAVRRRVQMRFVLTGACAVAGIGAAFSINADERGFAGTTSILGALIVLACMAVRLDAAGGRTLWRALLTVERRFTGRR